MMMMVLLLIVFDWVRDGIYNPVHRDEYQKYPKWILILPCGNPHVDRQIQLELDNDDLHLSLFLLLLMLLLMLMSLLLLSSSSSSPWWHAKTLTLHMYHHASPPSSPPLHVTFFLLWLRDPHHSYVTFVGGELGAKRDGEEQGGKKPFHQNISFLVGDAID